MAITKFDKETCSLVQEEIKSAIRPILEKHGLTLKPRGGTFYPTKYEMKLELMVKETADGISGEQAEFNLLCSRYGCKPDHYGKIITGMDGEKYKLIGFLPRRSKFPVLTLSLRTGKRTIFTEHTLQQIRK